MGFHLQKRCIIYTCKKHFTTTHNSREYCDEHFSHERIPDWQKKKKTNKTHNVFSLKKVGIEPPIEENVEVEEYDD